MRVATLSLLAFSMMTSVTEAQAPLPEYEIQDLTALANPTLSSTAIEVDRAHHAIRLCHANENKDGVVEASCQSDGRPMIPPVNANTTLFSAIPYSNTPSVSYWAVDQQDGDVYFCGGSVQPKCWKAVITP
jgi:hypothetical protein